MYLQRTPEAQAVIGKEYAPDVTQASPDIAEQLHLMEQVRNLRKQLSESSSRWEEVMEEAAEAIAVIDLSGRVIYANGRWRDLLGVEGEEIRRYDLRTIMEELIVMQRELPGVDGRWTLNLQLPEYALPARVDRTRIEQVLINLLDNTRKYSPDGGPITITLRKEGHEAQIAITDTGIGIPERDIPRLFTPFFRATNASSRHFPGVDLGLYLCQSIMQAHGGRIAVTSRQGYGTTFVLSLPYEIMKSGEVQG